MQKVWGLVNTFVGSSFIDFKIRPVSEYGSLPGVLVAWGVLGAVHALHFRVLNSIPMFLSE